MSAEDAAIVYELIKSSSKQVVKNGGAKTDLANATPSKAQVLADASKLSGEELTSFLEREGIKLADFERWRIALEEEGGGSA